MLEVFRLSSFKNAEENSVFLEKRQKNVNTWISQIQ